MAPEPPEGMREEMTRPTETNGVERGNPDSSDDEHEYEGYEPLPLAPPDDFDLRTWNSELVSPDSSDDETEKMDTTSDNANANADTAAPPDNVPFIESVDREITREIWTSPTERTDIEMDPARVEQVMSAMANFSLPPSSFPEWAHCVSEEEWRRQLATRIDVKRGNR